MHCLQSWPPGCVTWVTTSPWITLLALSVSIDSLSSSARVTSVKSYKRLGVTDGWTSGPIDRTPGLPGSDKKILALVIPTKNIFCKKNGPKRSFVASAVVRPIYIRLYGATAANLMNDIEIQISISERSSGWAIK